MLRRAIRKACPPLTGRIACTLALFASLWLGVGVARAETAAMTGNWRGTYTCQQGLTGVTLAIDEQDGAAFSGVFQFGAVATNPSVPEGCFEVSGRVTPAGRVEIVGQRWIKRPAGYVTVDFTGQLSSDRRRFLGVVTTPGHGALCTSFRVDKVGETPAIAPLCRREAPNVSLLR